MRLTALRDILWSLEHDLLQTIDQVTWLGHLDQEACPRAGVGRLAVVEQGGRLHPRIELDETVLPPRLAQAFRDQRIRHLFFMLVVDSFP